MELLPYGSFVARATLRGKLFPTAFSRNSSLSAWSPPLRIRCEPTGGLSRRDKLAIAQRFSLGHALGRSSRVPEGGLLWSRAHSTGAGLSRPSGTQMLATGPLTP